MNAPALPIPTRGLWSLWDMLELKAGAFQEAVGRLSEIEWFVRGMTTATEVNDQEHRVFHEDTALDDGDRQWIEARLTMLEAHLGVLDTPITKLALDDAREKISFHAATWKTVREQFQDVQQTLRRELSLRAVLVLEAKEQALYAPSEPPFGAAVATAFPSEAAYEIDEAGKCLALGRSTACVFHLMRTMEAGLRAVGKCLGIPDPVRAADRNWGNMLQRIKDEMDERTQKKSGKAWISRTDKDLFASVYVTLDAIRAAWRNTTMHVESKYTPDEAEHIFNCVRMFMKTLAARCDEAGNPVA